MSRKKSVSLVSWLMIVAWMTAACGPAQLPPTVETPHLVAERQAEREREAAMAELRPVSLDAGEKLRVIATTNIVAHVVSQVGGDDVELIQLLPTGADPHTYIATPQDMAAVADAHVIFANGVNLEAGFLPQLIRDTDAELVYVSSGIELRELAKGEAHEHEQEREAQGHLSPEGSDPHTWTTPTNVAIFVGNIESTLDTLDPANADAYKANAEAYKAELNALDEWVKAEIATIPTENRVLVADHTTLGYYADHYGLKQIGAVIPAFSTAAEPSAQGLAALEDAIREYGARAVFVGTTVNPSLAAQVADDTGVQLVTLYTGSLGPQGSGVETYVDYICYNTAAIVEALGGTPDVVGPPCE